MGVLTRNERDTNCTSIAPAYPGSQQNDQRRDGSSDKQQHPNGGRRFSRTRHADESFPEHNLTASFYKHADDHETQTTPGVSSASENTSDDEERLNLAGFKEDTIDDLLRGSTGGTPRKAASARSSMEWSSLDERAIQEMEAENERQLGEGTAEANTEGTAEGGDMWRELCRQNVFIFHLPPNWGEADLVEHFEQFGEIISVKVVTRPDGRSKGYGFVCYADESTAIRACVTMNGFTAGNKKLRVSLKKTPEDCIRFQVDKLLESVKDNRPTSRMNKQNGECALFVFHIPPEWSDEELRRTFAAYGTITGCRICRTQEKVSRGYGFVTFKNVADGAVAMGALNGAKVGKNKRLKVQLKQKKVSGVSVGGVTVFVFHIPNEWDDTELRHHFQHFGKIISAVVQRDNNSRNRGFAFVTYERAEDAIRAIRGMDGFVVNKKRLQVSLKRGSIIEPLSYDGCSSNFDDAGTLSMASNSNGNYSMNFTREFDHQNMPQRRYPHRESYYSNRPSMGLQL